MENRIEEGMWAFVNSKDYAIKTQELDEDEEEEALSFSDLPIIHHQFKTETDDKENRARNENQDDFDFCSLSKESKMCAADDVFFQGQILPLRRHSETGLLKTRSVSRSESMDHFYSGGLISSRSSSISSYQSSSSGSSSSTTQTRRRHPKPPRNQFHSHPSPSPRILHSSNRKHGLILNSTTNFTYPSKKSSVWSIFRLGLVTPPPEIAFQDLKTRNRTNSKSFGSRNSTSSNSSSYSNGSTKNSKSEEKKSVKKPLTGFLNGCRCSVNDAVPSRIVIIKRNASESEETRFLRLDEEEEGRGGETVQPTKMQEAKKRLSHHRTFEWLKQLSIEGAEDDEDGDNA